METSRRNSLMDHFFNMLRMSNNPTVPLGDDENNTDADEPPDDQLSELNQNFHKESPYNRSSKSSGVVRRESLLTRAILAGSETSPTSPRSSDAPRGMSTASSHSFASTAELTSDGGSPARSASPSPPPPASRISLATPKQIHESTKVIIAPITKDDKPVVAEVGEAAVEKTLGRKRCIMFACSNTPSETPKEAAVALPAKETPKSEPAPRKCRLTFACPTRQDSASDTGMFSQAPAEKSKPQRRASPAPSPRVTSPRTSITEEVKVSVVTDVHATKAEPQPSNPLSPLSPSKTGFHEFASSHDETDDWVEKASELNMPKLTLDDCLKKENAIRRIGKEAEEEAEAEEREQEELENELEEDEDDVDDDFAPSDEDESDDGNESDDEEGFADSDDESDAGSDYQFWAPSTTTAATSAENVPHFFRQSQRSRASSESSSHSESGINKSRKYPNRRPSKLAIKMRPATPELPDSTDFVCGTLDEDRPLEAAYISCREQRRQQKRVLIPQDIDPSFPTTDPEDEEDDNDDDQLAESSDHIWMKDQFVDFDDETRGRRKPSTIRITPLHSPTHLIAPPRQPVLCTKSLRGSNRSPPPKHNIAKSPAPRRLFDHPPKRLRSPPPTVRLRSPRGSPTNTKPMPLGITINRLAQRPRTAQTSSLPHTPNPFFRNWRNGSPAVSRIASAAVSPGDTEPRHDVHVRGPVDIVIGLEKKRQKRKERFWRQHCRKAAKEQAERRPPPGRGVERMKELGLECAERTRGYGLGQPAQLVLSL